ncbi:hypothetical protein [Microcystis aeruginosa]|uniref:hypothetical protein n=1 Tax=Microcystis aeruginosa TaxID=1126 RepID=UPI0018EEE9C5|nr:hypothetical protein [Microcystis aeruginosa]MDB9420159.1 hypothetical protein [Microcystis aeruginosa CS-563/04]
MDEKETGLNEREGNSGNGTGCGGKSPINGRGNYGKFKKMAGESRKNQSKGIEIAIEYFFDYRSDPEPRIR